MEYLNIGNARCGVETLDNVSGAGSLRIAFRGEDDTGRATRMPFYIKAREGAAKHGAADVDQVRFKPDEDDLCFGIAKADVIFE